MTGVQTCALPISWPYHLVNLLLLCRLSFGELAWPYHLVNLLLFCAAAFLIYFFARKVLEDEQAGILAAFFYLVHPINGLVVNFVTASVFSAQVILMLASMCFWVGKGLLSKAAGIFFFVLALMCHETAMALPLYLVVLVWIKTGSLRRAWSVTMPLFIFTFFYFLLRLHIASLDDTVLHNFKNSSFNAFEYAAGYSKLVFWYLEKLI